MYLKFVLAHNGRVLHRVFFQITSFLKPIYRESSPFSFILDDSLHHISKSTLCQYYLFLDYRFHSIFSIIQYLLPFYHDTFKLLQSYYVSIQNSAICYIFLHFCNFLNSSYLPCIQINVKIIPFQPPRVGVSSFTVQMRN